MAADPRFFPCSGPRSLEEVLAAAEGTAEGGAAEHFTGVAALGEAGPGEITFCDGARHVEALRVTRAAAVIVAAAQQLLVPAAAIAIVVRNPALAFARVASLFHPPPPPQPGVHPTAVLGEGVVLGDGVEIGPYAVIGARARIGAGSIIGPHVVVGEAVELGEGCRLHAHASISHAICGPRVVLHPGARIGQEGFGFVPTPDGRFVTVPQLGLVRLGEGVEIGANSCVDRGSQSDTVLGPGTRLDNLVQVGHNVRTGRARRRAGGRDARRGRWRGRGGEPGDAGA